jgi:hypothetical protein
MIEANPGQSTNLPIILKRFDTVVETINMDSCGSGRPSQHELRIEGRGHGWSGWSVMNKQRRG